MWRGQWVMSFCSIHCCWVELVPWACKNGETNKGKQHPPARWHLAVVLWKLPDLVCLIITVTWPSHQRRREMGHLCQSLGTPLQGWGRDSERWGALFMMSHPRLDTHRVFQSKKPSNQDIIFPHPLLRPFFFFLALYFQTSSKSNREWQFGLSHNNLCSCF